ncbi:uncharacterized protein LOC120353597 isoform X3 [Nilaparvata lugens]|nr:uncharacterized protein LOC120353597 isoform X3 [Nilaparvata lugens]
MNWENSTYFIRYFRFAEFRKLNVTLLPSNVPDDYSFYLPVLWRKKKSQLFRLQLFQITESGLTVIVKIRFPRPEELLKVCVMRNSFVFITVSRIFFFDGHQLRTIMQFFVPDPPYEPPFLTMDTHHILFFEQLSHLIIVWCKQSIKPIYHRLAEPDIYMNCSLFDGCLIISSGENDYGKTSRIEVRNLRNAHKMLQLIFLVDGKVKYLDMNERFLFMNIRTYDYRCIQVRDKESYSITYCYKYSMPCCMTHVSDDFVILKESLKNSIRSQECKILDFATGEWYTVSSSRLSNRGLQTSCDNRYIITFSGEKNSIKILDWRNNNIHILQDRYFPKSEDFVIIGVTDLMIVAIDLTTGIMINIIFEKSTTK